MSELSSMKIIAVVWLINVEREREIIATSFYVIIVFFTKDKSSHRPPTLLCNKTQSSPILLTNSYTFVIGINLFPHSYGDERTSNHLGL